MSSSISTARCSICQRTYRPALVAIDCYREHVCSEKCRKAIVSRRRRQLQVEEQQQQPVPPKSDAPRSSPFSRLLTRIGRFLAP